MAFALHMRASMRWRERLVVYLLKLLAVIEVLNIASGPFIRFHGHSPESECMTNLKAWFIAESSWYGERREYLTNFATIGFAPEGRHNRYLYTDDPLGSFGSAWSPDPHTGILPSSDWPYPLRYADIPARVAGGEIVGVTGTCPDCRASAVCVAQLDNDDEVDVWSISTVDRIDEVTGAIVVAGVPFHERTDRHRQRSLPERWLRL
ncbi:MAG: hypothetical protein QM723_30040 [Myxococcaceae bacterium]